MTARPNPADLLPRLMAEFGYPRPGAELLAQKLVGMSDTVWRAFWAWWETGVLPDLAIEGYTVQRLLAEHNMKLIAAFLTLDYLCREPEKARASLRKGHDRVR
jgi:hypothetical protein